MDSIARARDYVRSRQPFAEAHSHEEMFLWLLERGADAREAGNYGIAAAFVLRNAGRELISFGQSTIFSEADPGGHAEMNALRLAARIGRTGSLPDARETGSVVIRDAPHEHFETLLYSTLEPCPMCTVALLNAGVQSVVVGCADEFAGALLRLSTLAPLWSEFAKTRDLSVTTLDSRDTRGDGVPAELLDHVEKIFYDAKEPLDGRLERSGALPYRELSALAARRPPST